MGQPSCQPAALVFTASATDPSLAPQEKHTLFVRGEFYPYKLADNLQWDSIKETEADRLLQIVGQYAPNVPVSVTARRGRIGRTRLQHGACGAR